MRVKNFAGFMKSKTNKARIFENEEGMDMGYYGANPEDEEASMMDEEMPEDEMEDEMDDEMEDDMDDEMEGEEEEPTMEDLKAMIDELTERVEALEGGDEEEEGEEDMEEEGEEDMEEEEGEEEDMEEEEEDMEDSDEGEK